jgi:hypothetical protein
MTTADSIANGVDCLAFDDGITVRLAAQDHRNDEFPEISMRAMHVIRFVRKRIRFGKPKTGHESLAELTTREPMTSFT